MRAIRFPANAQRCTIRRVQGGKETTSRYGRDEEDRAAAQAADVQRHHDPDASGRCCDAHDRWHESRHGRSPAGRPEAYDLPRHGRGNSRRQAQRRNGIWLLSGTRQASLACLRSCPPRLRSCSESFAEYIRGDRHALSLGGLNAEGVPAPRGPYFRCAVTLTGHTKRRTGLLQCELYVGKLVWNRSYRVRDPDSGRREWRYRLKASGYGAQAPHLRMIADGVWGDAQTARSVRSRATRQNVRSPSGSCRGFCDVAVVRPECRSATTIMDDRASSAPA